jgi:hypothetical protein
MNTVEDELIPNPLETHFAETVIGTHVHREEDGAALLRHAERSKRKEKQS